MHDGEIVAAARAMRRFLEREGLTFNDLGRALEDGEGGRVDREPERGVVLHSWFSAVACIRLHPLWDPTDRERQFIADIGRILGRRAPSEKQQQWVRDIVARLGGRIHA